MDPFTVGLIFLCAASFMTLLPALRDGVMLIRRVTREASARRQSRKKISSSGY
jgi:hypothetical protein